MIINYKVFLISFILGIFFVYMVLPQNKVIVVYPTPDNINKISVKDTSNTCFKYKAQKVSCPNDKSKIFNYPVQT
jgi:hypothetical protein